MKSIPKIFEILRYIGVFIGFFLAFYYTNPIEQLNILSAWLVLSISGLTGLESLFFGKIASESIGYKSAPEYQRQSGINNLSVAVITLVAIVFSWGFYAFLALLCCMLLFLFLSGCNHAWSYTKGNKNIKNFMRLIMAVILINICAPFIYHALIAYAQLHK